MRILAIDLGYKHTGLAMFDETLGISPLANVEHKDLYELLSKLMRFIEDYGFDKILVGDMGGGENEEYLNKFVDILQSRLNLKCEIVSERYSSKQATKEIQNTGNVEVKKDHASAAVQILRDYVVRDL